MSLITLILVLAAAAVLIVLGTTRRKDGGDGKKTLPRTIVTAAAVLVLVGALGFGSVYQLQEDEYAVITTFGKPSVVSTSGLKFKIPIIQQKTIVSKATQGFALGYDLRTNVNNEDESLMISVDFNFVNVDFYVEYRVDDPVKYLYNSEEPEAILKMLCQSYIRDTIGLYGVDDIITTGKAEIQGVIRDKISTRLEQEDIGLVLVNIALQDAEPPTLEVQQAFKAVETSKQEAETAINNANKYANEQLPAAKANADEILQQAEAYKESRIAEAEGQASRFTELYDHDRGGAVIMENNNTRRPAHVGRTIVIAVLAVVILVLLLSSLYVVQPNEYGVVRQFGAVVDVKSEPGLYFKIPFVQEMSTLPNTVLLYDLPVSDMISADKTTLIADCFAIWRIEDPRLFIETLSGSVSNAEGRINANVYNALKTVLSSMTQAEIISGRDGTLVRTVMATIGDSFDRYGIELIAVETKKIDLPDDNKSAVFSRMISERNNIAAGYLAEGESRAKEIRNEADKQVQILLANADATAATVRAEGDAEYMRILSEVYDSPEEAEFYTFMIALDALQTSMTGAEKTLILDADSPIAKLFY